MVANATVLLPDSQIESDQESESRAAHWQDLQKEILRLKQVQDEFRKTWDDIDEYEAKRKMEVWGVVLAVNLRSLMHR